MSRPKRPRHNYEGNKLFDLPNDNHDGRPSLIFEDPLIDRLKLHHFIDRKGKICERPQEPPELPPDPPPELPPDPPPELPPPPDE